MKTSALIFLSFIITLGVYAQKDWSKVDFADEYKRKVKIKGGAAKSLKKNKTFVTYYSVSQATAQKGSEKTADNAIFMEVSLAGLNNNDYQQMVNELHEQLISELKEAGLKVTDGTDVLASDYAQKRIGKDKRNEFIGNTGTNTMFEGKKKITEGMMPGYAGVGVSRDISFLPVDKNIYYTSNYVKSGLFYGNLSKKEDFNLMTVQYYVSFASFDGGRGYKDIKIESNPVIAVTANIMIYTPNGSFNKIFYKKLPAWGSGKWSNGVRKGKDNKSTADFLGLARSAEWEFDADPDKYMKETRAILSNLQKDIVDGIEEEL